MAALQLLPAGGSVTPRPPSKWIRFSEAQVPARLRTRIWLVKTLDAQDRELGLVRWYAPWRRYAFYPGQPLHPLSVGFHGARATIFEAQCLRDLAAFLDWATAERKAERVRPAGGGEL